MDTQLQPYSRPPMYTEEELAAMQRQAGSNVEMMPEANDANDYECECCQCGRADKPENQKCCLEEDYEKVWVDGERPTLCIGETEEVDYLMQEVGLQIAWRQDEMWKGKTGDRLSTVHMDNQNYRYHAYRKYIKFIHGRLGHGNRRLIPSCIVQKIQGLWPSPDGKYVGNKLAQSAAASLDRVA